MTLAVQMLFDTPRQELASRLAALYSQCASASLVAGFMTVEEIEAISAPMRADLSPEGGAFILMSLRRGRRPEST